MIRSPSWALRHVLERGEGGREGERERERERERDQSISVAVMKGSVVVHDLIMCTIRKI